MAIVNGLCVQRYKTYWFKMILMEECNVGAQLLGWCSGDRCTPWENTNQEPPTDVTDVHRLGGYGIPAIPTQPLNYLPTEATEPYAA